MKHHKPQISASNRKPVNALRYCKEQSFVLGENKKEYKKEVPKSNLSIRDAPNNKNP